VTLDVQRTFKINGSKVKVTAWQNVSAAKYAIIQVRISCQRSNLVKIISEQSVTRYMAFEVIRSNNNSAADCSIVFKSGTELRCKCSSQMSKVKVTGSKVKVTA